MSSDEYQLVEEREGVSRLLDNLQTLLLAIRQRRMSHEQKQRFITLLDGATNDVSN